MEVSILQICIRSFSGKNPHEARLIGARLNTVVLRLFYKRSAVDWPVSIFHRILHEIQWLGGLVINWPSYMQSSSEPFDWWWLAEKHQPQYGGSRSFKNDELHQTKDIHFLKADDMLSTQKHRLSHLSERLFYIKLSAGRSFYKIFFFGIFQNSSDNILFLVWV